MKKSIALSLSFGTLSTLASPLASEMSMTFPIKMRRDTTLLRRGTNGTDVGLINLQGDSLFTMSVAMGTPSQNLDLYLTANTADFIIADQDCPSAPCPDGVTKFKHSSSSTYHTAGKAATLVWNPSGPISAVFGTDTVTIGGKSVTNQTLVVVEDAAPNRFTPGASGSVGLGLQPLAADGQVPWWQKIAGNTDGSGNTQFSVFLNRYTTNDEFQAGGVLTLGGVNTDFVTGDIEYHDPPSGVTPKFWYTSLTKMTVQGQPFDFGSSSLVQIGLGGNLFGGPTDIVKKFYATIPGSNALSGSLAGRYSIPCTTNVSFSVSFGGRDWPIDVQDFNLGQLDDTGKDCVGLLYDFDDRNEDLIPGLGQWYFGTFLLKNIFTVFQSNPPRVGFGQFSPAALAAATSSIAPRPSTPASGGGSSGGSSSGAVAHSAFAGVVFALSVGVISAVAMLAC